MEYEGPERMPPTPLDWKDPRETHGQLLWPDGFSETEVRRLKESFTPARYACQIQQRPPEQDVDAEFPASYFGESIWFDDWPPAETHVLRVMSLDPSTGRGEHCDYSAFVLALRDTEGRTWIEADLDRRDVTQLSTRAVALAEAFRPIVFGVETNGFQYLLREPLQQALDHAGLRVDLCEVRTTTSKVLRIRSLSLHLARSHLRFRRTRGTELLVDQLRAFPSASHDDGPDALEQALRLIDERSSPRPEIEIDWAGA
jgi:predicted phage terminase large subunit-like protein